VVERNDTTDSLLLFMPLLATTFNVQT